MGGTSAVVIYEGNKFFWRKRVTIDVMIVEHKEFDVTEVITYEPSINVEASRIYLDSLILSSKINQEEIAAKMSFAKQHNVPHTIQFVNGVLNRATSDYILNRLFITEFSVDPKNFSVELQFNFRDRDVESGGDNIDRLIRDKPADLSPHKAIHYKAVVAGEADAAITALEEEKRTLTEDTTKAEEFEDKTRDPLGIQQRWRIPIVLAKVAKNAPLSEGDSQIWSAVASNLSSEQAIENATKVTTRIVNPSPSPKRTIKPPIPTGRDGTPVLSPISSASVSPNRSPCPTPRRRSLDKTPVDPLRYMAGTATSHLRTLSVEEPEKPAVKKLFRRGSKLGASSKGKSTKRRRSMLGAHSASTDVEDAEAMGFTSSSFGESDDTVSLIGHLAAGLASISGSFRASFSSKNRGKIHIVDAEEAGMVKLDSQFSFLSSFKSASFKSGSFKASTKEMSLECRETTSTDANDLSHQQLPGLSCMSDDTLDLPESQPALNRPRFDSISLDLLSLGESTSPRLKQPRFSFKDAVSQFTAEDAHDHSHGHTNECTPTPTGLAVFFGSGVSGRGNAPVHPGARATSPLTIDDSECDLSQLEGHDPSEITPPRKRHYYFSSLLASFSDSSNSSSDKSTGQPAPPLVHQKPPTHPASSLSAQDSHAKQASMDPSIGLTHVGATNATAALATPVNTSTKNPTASAKYSTGASGKKRQLSFGEALSGWLKWSNSSKSSKVAPAPAPLPEYEPPALVEEFAVRIFEARYM